VWLAAKELDIVSMVYEADGRALRSLQEREQVLPGAPTPEQPEK
jgi:hypothetical protein